MFRKHIYTLIAVAALVAGCGGGGANSMFTAPGGTVTGYVYASSYNTTAAGRAAGREADATPSGYTPVANATVVVTGTSLTTTTDANGYFSLSEVRAGTVTLKVTKTGMTDLTLQVTVKDGQTTNANESSSNAAMTMAPTSHGTLIVTTTAGAGNFSVPVSGATVLINNITTNKTTPAAINDIALLDASATPYTVTVTAPGYNTVLPQNATVNSATPNVTLNFTLVPTDGNNAPYPNISSPSDGSTYDKGQTITFTGAGTDPEDGGLTGASLVWTSSRDGQIGTGTILQIATLTSGKHTITLTATDSKGKTGAATIEVTVTDTTATNTAPTANIYTPTDGAAYTTAQTVTFTGAATDPEDGALIGTSLVWTSSRDGSIGTGPAIQKTGLSAGTHVITLTATDAGGKSGTKSVTITVSSASTANTAPTAFIATPADGATGTTNTRFTFSGTGIDTEDGNLSGTSLKWTSSLDGTLGTGNYLTKTLSSGTHIITLTATDANGATNSDTATVVVSTSATPNTGPAAVIATPTDGATGTTNTTFAFTGAGVDAEDGTITGDSLVWTSSRDGKLGTGAALAKSLTAGTHTITLTVTDAKGLTGSYSITVIVYNVNTAPTVTIVTPINGTIATPGMTINFAGAAVDAEDGTLTGTSLVWSSSLDGTLGTGNIIAHKLTAGTHTIKLTATDSNGGSDYATRSVIVR